MSDEILHITTSMNRWRNLSFIMIYQPVFCEEISYCLSVHISVQISHVFYVWTSNAKSGRGAFDINELSSQLVLQINTRWQFQLRCQVIPPSASCKSYWPQSIFLFGRLPQMLPKTSGNYVFHEFLLYVLLCMQWEGRGRSSHRFLQNFAFLLLCAMQWMLQPVQWRKISFCYCEIRVSMEIIAYNTHLYTNVCTCRHGTI